MVNDYNPYFSSKPTYSQLNLKYTYAKIGEYPQAKIKKNELTEEIINLDYNISGVGSYGDKKILRKEYEASYEYYWVENILWRVIECDDEKAVLWSDCIIDSKNFNDLVNKTDNVQLSTQLKWSESKLRNWLNKEFYETAFSDKEKKSIIIQEYENYSSEFGYPMGENDRKKYTVDKTKDMVSIRDYYSLTGFWYDCPYKIKGKENEAVSPDISQYLKCNNTDYAMAQFISKLPKGKMYYEKYVPGYWTKTPITNTGYLEYVSITENNAMLFESLDDEERINFCESILGVRPVIVIKKSDLQKYIIE